MAPVMSAPVVRRRRSALLWCAGAIVTAMTCASSLAFAEVTSAVATLVQPKRPASSYMVWLKANRAKIVERIGSKSISDVGKAAGEEWNSLQPKDKAKFEKDAAKLKAQYEKDKEEFLAAGGEFTTKKKKALTTKKTKDPNAPKRSMNAYMYWLADNRADIAATLKPDEKHTEVLKKAGVLWGEIKPAAKKKYETKAVKAKATYQKELAEYEASKPDQADEE